MNELQESLISALQLSADNAVQQSGLPKTIECKIIEVKDAGIGLYLANYMGNDFDVYSSSPTNAYKEEDNVLVIVPDGDMSKIKYIIGSVAPDGVLYSNTEVVDDYVPVDGQIFKYIGANDVERIALCSFEPTEETYVSTLDASAKTMLQSYLQNGKRDFAFMADVQTDLIASHQHCGGYYGLTLSIPIKRPSVSADAAYDLDVITSTLDVTTMEGDPYNFITIVPQKMNISIPENAEIDMSRNIELIARVSNFTEAENQPDDIWFSNIRLQSNKALSFTEDNGNRLVINVKNDVDTFYATSATTKTLEPVLYINRKLTSINGYDCYWFVKDNRVNETSNEFYESHGGFGWKCLNRKQNLDTSDEGGEGFQWITDDYLLTVSKEDVLTSLEYKCIIVSGTFYIEEKIQIYNLQPQYEFELTTDNGAMTFNKDYGVIPITASIRELSDSLDWHNIQMKWMRYNEGSTTPITENAGTPQIVRPSTKDDEADAAGHYWTREKVTYPSSLVNGSNRIECTFYENNLETGEIRNIGTASIVVSTEKIYDYKIIIINDRYEYKYDAEGNSPMVSDYDGSKSAIADMPKEIKPISFMIVDKDNNELSKEEYTFCNITWQVPKNSMILAYSGTSITPTQTSEDYDYYTFHGKENSDFYYQIRNSFDLNKKDNTIILTVDYKGAPITQNVHLNFLKDGQEGTNGTRFSAEITYNGFAYGEVSEDPLTGRYIRNRFLPVFLFATQYEGPAAILTTCLYKPHAAAVGTSTEYVYDKLVDWNNLAGEDKCLEVKVYKDGKLITDPTSIYTVKWSMLDPRGTGTIFSVGADTGIISGADGAYTPTFHPTWTSIGEGHYKPVVDEDTSPCNIVKAEITILSSATDVNRQQVLYAFYPIDFIVARTYGGSRYDYENEYNFFDLKDGYDSVMYDEDGTLPKTNGRESDRFNMAPGYSLVKDDATNITDYFDFENSDYTYWTTQHTDNFVEINPQGLDCQIRPANKYDNGETKGLIVSYGKVLHDIHDSHEYYNEDTGTWETEYTDVNGVESVISGLDEEIYEDNLILTEYAEFRQALADFQIELDNGQNFDYNNYREKLLGSKPLLVSRLKLYLQLQDLIDKITELKSYDEGLSPIITITPTSANALSFCNNVIEILLGLGQDNRLSDIPDYFVTSGTTEMSYDEATMLDEHGLAENEVMKSKIQAINDMIADYLAEVNVIYNYTDEYTNFEDLRTLLYHYYDYEWNVPLGNLVDVTWTPNDAFVQHRTYILNLVEKIGTADYISYNSVEGILNDFKNSHMSFKNSYYNDYYNTLYNNLKAIRDKKVDKRRDFIAFGRFEYIGYYKSIHLYLNYYSKSNLNTWDGSKIFVDEDEQYILAPQMGAGYKDNANKYTGVVMGITNVNAGNTSQERTQRVGLLGLSHGEQSFFLSAETGSAVFGKTGPGQIILDPTRDAAEIYSSNYFFDYNKEGMPTSYGASNQTGKGTLINLTESYIHFGENVSNYVPTSLLDSRHKLDYDVVTGIINNYFAPYHMDNFTMNGVFKNVFEYGDEDCDTAHDYAYYTAIAVSSAGYMVLFSADANAGRSNFDMTKSAVSGGTNFRWYFSGGTADGCGEICIYQYVNGVWTNVSNDYGAVVGYFSYAYSGTFNVTINATFESDWMIFKGVPNMPTSIGKYGRIYSGKHDKLKSVQPGFYLDNTGLSIGSKFKVAINENDGNECTLTLGLGAVDNSSAKHWTIDSNADGESFIGYNTTRFQTGVSDGQVYLGTDGIRLGSKFKVDNFGNLTANYLVATGGSIGGWAIGASSLSASGVTLNANGDLSGGSGNTAWSITNSNATFKTLYATDYGQIGGWTINGDNLTSGSLTLAGGSTSKISGYGFELDSSGLKLSKNGTTKLRFDSQGNLTVTGVINATSGVFGSYWTLDASGFSYTGTTVINTTAKITPGLIASDTGYFNHINTTVSGPNQGDATIGTVNAGTLNVNYGGQGYMELTNIIKDICYTKGEINTSFYGKTTIDSMIQDVKDWCNQTFAPAGSYASASHTHHVQASDYIDVSGDGRYYVNINTNTGQPQ